MKPGHRTVCPETLLGPSGAAFTELCLPKSPWVDTEGKLKEPALARS